MFYHVAKHIGVSAEECEHRKREWCII